MDIVLIDDDPAIVEVLSRVLATRPGISSMGFTESGAALQWPHRHAPALEGAARAAGGDRIAHTPLGVSELLTQAELLLREAALSRLP